MQEFFFQNENPNKKDLIKNKNHTNIANKIKTIILDKNKKFNLIGINGSLGSGKSTIIKIVEEDIKRQKTAKEYIFINFDLKINQYGLLKKSLIKTINQELIRQIPNQKEKIQHIADRALGRLSSYTKETNSKIKPEVIALLIAFMFSARFSREALKVIFKMFEGIFNTEDIAVLLIFAAPFLIATSFLLLDKTKNKNYLSNFFKRNSKDKIQEKLEIDKEVDSIELQNAFTKFDEIIKKNNIEIVLCIDNIDRLSNTKMQDFFSEISAFAQLTNTKNSFNIILPFCKNKIRSKKSNSEQECFDTKIPIIIRVPPLTKSQWHQLLLKYFQITFCKINTEKFNINLLYGLIDLFIDTNKEINPRFLKKYINDIYIEYIMQNNKDDYEIIYICASYVIAHNYKNIKISDLIDNNNEAELIKNFHHLINNYITTDKFSLELLSVHYRTDPKNAANEFITTELETTIQNKDYVNFCSLHNRFNQFIETFTNKINNLNNNDYKNIVHIKPHSPNF